LFERGGRWKRLEGAGMGARQEHKGRSRHTSA
jgi:hypothetical protein